MILLMTKSLSHSRQPLSLVNLTGFTMLLSGKSRKYTLKKKKSLKTSLKTGFDQISPVFTFK